MIPITLSRDSGSPGYAHSLNIGSNQVLYVGQVTQPAGGPLVLDEVLLIMDELLVVKAKAQS
ncbi:MAG: hypothetical protein AB1791_07380 [Chloroflexota bacterium]